jgi:hypothetical protein
MMPSPLIDDRPRTNPLSQALDRQCPQSSQVINFACSRTANVASQAAAGPSVVVPTGKTIASIASIQTHQPGRRDQIPIAFAAPPPHTPPRFRALALFGRRRPQGGDS